MAKLYAIYQQPADPAAFWQFLPAARLGPGKFVWRPAHRDAVGRRARGIPVRP